MAARGRLGALVTLSRYDRREINAKARATFIASFADKAAASAAERGETLTPEEAARRGEFARRAHYQRMALASAAARRRSRPEAA